MPDEVSDIELARRASSGDAAALKALMSRYDKLVRYAIFRTSRRESMKDALWIDSIAGDAWMGFLASIEKMPALSHAAVRGYLVKVARNRTISALRAQRRNPETAQDFGDAASTQPDPEAVLSRLEELERLRSALRALPATDQHLLSEIELILDRRWVDAGVKLGLSESTVRSKWGRLLQRIAEFLGG